MREYHVFFLYYAHHVFAPFVDLIPNGALLLKTMDHLIYALDLVKGFSTEVCTHMFYIASL
jgi:hypothetical protein